MSETTISQRGDGFRASVEDCRELVRNDPLTEYDKGWNDALARVEKLLIAAAVGADSNPLNARTQPS